MNVSIFSEATVGAENVGEALGLGSVACNDATLDRKQRRSPRRGKKCESRNQINWMAAKSIHSPCENRQLRAHHLEAAEQ